MIRSRTLALLLLLLLAVATACSAGGDSADTAAAPEDTDTGYEMGTEDAQTQPDDAAPTDDADRDEGAAGLGGHDGEVEPLPPATPAVARNPERVIKEGTMTIEVAEGEFRAAFTRVIETARSLGGASMSSSAQTHDDGSTAGTVTIRVPVDRYDELLTGMDRIGTLRSQDISSTDVTGEYTDLESRLRHARAQEAFYMGLLERAEGVQDAIAVKQQLDSIQGQIEQAQGRLNVLADRTAFSSLTVEIVEPGAVPVIATVEDERPALAAYLGTARDGFVTVVGAMIVVGVSTAPLVVPALLLLAAWRTYARRPRTATVTADRA